MSQNTKISPDAYTGLFDNLDAKATKNAASAGASFIRHILVSTPRDNSTTIRIPTGQDITANTMQHMSRGISLLLTFAHEMYVSKTAPIGLVCFRLLPSLEKDAFVKIGFEGLLESIGWPPFVKVRPGTYTHEFLSDTQPDYERIVAFVKGRGGINE